MLATVFGAPRRVGAPRAPQPGDEQLGLLTEILFGEIWSRPALTPRERSMCTVATLIALNREGELRSHLRGALNLGISREKLLEMVLHLAFYSGAPTANRALAVAREVFAQGDAVPQPSGPDSSGPKAARR